jgi:hypothetical protein
MQRRGAGSSESYEQGLTPPIPLRFRRERELRGPCRADGGRRIALVRGGAARILWAGIALVATLTLPATTVAAEGLTAREIMQRVEDRDEGNPSIIDVEMTLIDKSGKKRLREIRAFGMDRGEDELQLLFFLSPADLEDTGFLTYDYDESGKDDDQWLYLPALRKTKRIASNDRSGRFMGSDFSYADLTSRDLDQYDYTLMKEAEVGGVKVWQIESVPRTKEEIRETGYTKSILFVRQDNYVVIRSVGWLKKGGRLKYMDVKALEKIDGVWIGTEIHMTTKKGQKTLHKTILRNGNIRLRQEIDEDFFTVRQLEKGL